MEFNKLMQYKKCDELIGYNYRGEYVERRTPTKMKYVIRSSGDYAACPSCKFPIICYCDGMYYCEKCSSGFEEDEIEKYNGVVRYEPTFKFVTKYDNFKMSTDNTGGMISFDFQCPLCGFNNSVTPMYLEPEDLDKVNKGIGHKCEWCFNDILITKTGEDFYQ